MSTTNDTDAADDSTDTDTDIVQNRSEILFAFDAVDANPNGNPLSGSDRPRIDEQTQQVIVTDVRVKRYLRDQLDDDGHSILIVSPNAEGGDALTREELFEMVIGVDDPADLPAEPLAAFLDAAADVRYFGATLSIDAEDDSVVDAALSQMPAHLTGAMQVQTGKSIHPVETNQQYNSLTSVIATKEGKQQGGFDLDDHRIKFGFIASNAVINENVAETTRLTQTDVERLDTLYWRAFKNQTNSRSKTGQNPRLYLRVEYATDHYHIGDLNTLLAVDEDFSKPVPEMRSCHDICVKMDRLVERLEAADDHIERLHVATDPGLRVSLEAAELDDVAFREALADRFGSDRVHVIDVYDEYEQTLA